MKATLITIAGTVFLLTLWFLAEENDYFNADYKVLTSAEQLEFTRQSDPTAIYTSYFGNDKYEFPRQNVDKIKLFTNKPFLQTLTPRTLKREFNSGMIDFFNDPENFHWGETTWLYRESEYILRFYNGSKVVGKVYLCLDKCGMTDTRPFTPNAKFGGLSDKGQKKLESIINDKEKWE